MGTIREVYKDQSGEILLKNGGIQITDGAKTWWCTWEKFMDTYRKEKELKKRFRDVVSYYDFHKDDF